MHTLLAQLTLLEALLEEHDGDIPRYKIIQLVIEKQIEIGIQQYEHEVPERGAGQSQA